MKGLVDEAAKLLTSGAGDFSDFGRLLDETWKLKRCLSDRISSGDVDALYETALRNGARGGKLLGAGGGGFILFFVEPERRTSLLKALGSYLHVPFRFEFGGSEIIVYQPDYGNHGER